MDRPDRPHRYLPYLLVPLVLALVAVPLVLAQDGEITAGGVLVRVDGNLTVGPNETLEVLVVVGEDSHANVSGTVGVLVVVGGTLDLHGIVQDRIVLVNSEATLHNGSRVRGDISTSDARVDERPGSRIDGTISETDLTRIGPIASLIFGIIFLVGVPIAFIVGGVLGVALFPRQIRTIGNTLTQDLGPTILTALAVWIALPLVAFLLLFTVIGIPTGLGLLLIVLPFLWIAGFISAGVKLGEMIVRRNAPPSHPYTAAVVGILILVVIGIFPFIGGVLVTIAGALGGAALVLAALRSSTGRWGGRLRRRRTPVDQAGPATRLEGEGRPRGEADQPWDPGAGGS